MRAGHRFGNGGVPMLSRYDPEFLAEPRPRAERLSLAEAESKRID